MGADRLLYLCAARPAVQALKTRREASKTHKRPTAETKASVYDDAVMQQSSAYDTVRSGERSVSSDVTMQDSRAYGVAMMTQPTNNAPMYEVVT